MFVVLMGQKKGMFPCFDHRLNHENRSVGQLLYQVPVCDCHQSQLRWDWYI